MAVTKQIYTAASGYTASDFANIFRSALIDAGLMLAWHDEFTQGSFEFRVLRVQHDPSKSYGSSFYTFVFGTNGVGVSLASGWSTASDQPTGTQYFDYHVLPPAVTSVSLNDYLTLLLDANISNASAVYLDRYTSQADSKQSWFVLRQGLTRSRPFTIVHSGTVLHSWLDLDKGIISGFQTVGAICDSRMGFVSFSLQENIRRCLLTGTALRGHSTPGARFHAVNYRTHCYVGIGSESANPQSNLGGSIAGSPSTGYAAAVALPVGKNAANPAYSVDYVPACSDLPWSPFTPTRLAADFAVYMHYADNTIAYGDKFIQQAGINEWEVLAFANNAVANDGASAAFLARVI